jgi:hypothetical protein
VKGGGSVDVSPQLVAILQGIVAVYGPIPVNLIP